MSESTTLHLIGDIIIFLVVVIDRSNIFQASIVCNKEDTKLHWIKILNYITITMDIFYWYVFECRIFVADSITPTRLTSKNHGECSES